DRMRIRLLIASAVGAAILLGAPVSAQAPAPTPAPSPPPAAPAPPPDYGAPISNEQAREVAAAALEEAKKNEWRMAIAIVSPDGNLVYFERMDGTMNASVAMAIAKARTSALFRRSTKVFLDNPTRMMDYVTFPAEARPVASEGGIPIIVEGKLIGAIGAA